MSSNKRNHFSRWNAVRHDVLHLRIAAAAITLTNKILLLLLLLLLLRGRTHRRKYYIIVGGRRRAMNILRPPTSDGPVASAVAVIVKYVRTGNRF